MIHLSGLIAAAYSPFRADGDLNLPVIDDLAGLYRESGVAGVFICGTTGESHSLTVRERQQIAERWMKASDERLPVIVHVGHNCQRDAMTLAAQAEAVGAQAIAAMAPSYFRPERLEDLIEFLAPIAEAAPNLPFYFYDIPGMTGVRFPGDHFLRLGELRIANLKGIKYTSDDFMAFQACLEMRRGAYDILFGCDELLLSGLAFGARGAVGSTYNYAAPVSLRVIEAWDQGDLPQARTEQHKTVQLVRVLSEFGVLRAGKAIMGLLGIDCGPVRSPMRPMTSEETRELYDRIRDYDIFSRPLRLPRVVTTA